ncbi:dihydroneopterin aldolase [Pseudanabaena sp. FACHB-2040]|uniref:dihydroneopterin aldolase n=1 Tax=Pseudanabaena sp. FACHB-2040 TaxID=2692859 RepID=UPI001682C262|nr:dihydroneopterin aldolase [Pseudanabaena sp. FACHB-2040]MBD2257176.1 dihydroneopterin aldolase [Pseudanabaena sp. FACHB-2040]
MDQLHITGIRAYGYTGALPEENVLGQWFEVDLTLWLDLTLAGKSDALADTHNYVYVVQAVQQLMRESRFQLIERLADAIATTVLTSDARLHQVKVRLIKLTPPIPDFSGQIAVEIVRQKD